jgi:uncharacterized membrane protein HdeD (DUF308 family)
MYIILGVLFCVFKAGVLDWLMTIAGILFIVFGVLDVIKGATTSGIINIAIGVVILVGGWFFLEVVLLVFGILLAVKGTIALVNSLKALNKRIFDVIFAALTIAVGIMLIVSKWALMDWFFIIMGVMFIIDGVLGLLGKKIVNR